MPVALDVHLVYAARIKVKKDRQRRDLGNLDSLASSIKRTGGLIHPIVITQNLELIVGERRLEAYRLLVLGPVEALRKWEKIPVRYFEFLSEKDKRLVEYEENAGRKALHWKEDVRAVDGYFRLRRDSEESFTIENCADELGLGYATVYNRISVALALVAGDGQVAACENLSQAVTCLRRGLSREMDGELESLMSDEYEAGFIDSDLESDRLADTGGLPTISLDDSPPIQNLVYLDQGLGKALRPAKEDIACANFIEWAEKYEGPRFNFLHCDFPYGINRHKSDQSFHETQDTYDDSPEVFWQLVDCLVESQDRLLADNCHIMFWFSMNYYGDLLREFAQADFKVQTHPLVWVKEDLKGIAPDVLRQPRRCYETALHITRGDRKIVKAIPNVSIQPSSSKLIHMDHKSPAVLRHFFRMYVDATTIMLDPTCGSGESLIQAEYNGARSVTGLDISEEFATTSTRRLNEFRLGRSQI